MSNTLCGKFFAIIIISGFILLILKSMYFIIYFCSCKLLESLILELLFFSLSLGLPFFSSSFELPFFSLLLSFSSSLSFLIILLSNNKILGYSKISLILLCFFLCKTYPLITLHKDVSL